MTGAADQRGAYSTARVRRSHVITAALTCLGLGLAPFVLVPYPLALLTLALAYGLFAFGLDLTWGRAGVVSIGHAAFFGVGAYGVAIAVDQNLSMLFGAVAGVVLAVLVAWIIGRIGLGSKTLPSTMAILTLALTLLAEQIALSWRSTTGGSNGLFVPGSGVVVDYYRTALIAVVVVGVVWYWIIRGQWGRRFRAVQSNEARAAHLGIDLRGTKVFSLCLSAAVAAAAGATAAPVMRLVSPGAAGIMLSAQVLVWLAVGGRGSIAGAFIGAIFVSMGQQYLGAAIGSWYLLVLGVMFILVVRFAPAGLVGTLRALLRRPKAESAAQGARLYTADVELAAETSSSSDPPQSAEHTDPALRITGVIKSYGATRVLRAVDLEVSDGEVICLIGPNGAGKTTLLDIVGGDQPGDSGEIRLFGDDVSGWTIHARARAGLGKVFQIPSVFTDLTPAQNLHVAQSQTKNPSPLPQAYVRFQQENSLLVADLPLADRRALEMAMVLVCKPQVILLDEPAAGLSHDESIGLARRLRAVAEQAGCTLITVEHDMEIVRELADRVVVLADGRVLMDGGMDDVAANQDVRDAYLGAQ